MKKNFTKAFACLLAVLLTVCAIPTGVLSAKADEMTWDEANVIVENKNGDFFNYASSDFFDIDYFKIPEQDETARADYEAKAKELTAGVSDTMQKVKAIYDWVRNNIYYDYDYYNAPSTHTTYWLANGVYENRRSVCEGYAALFVQMLRCVGIPARKIHGYAGAGDSPSQWANLNSTNHAWTEFYCDGKWHFADPTWDSGNTYKDSTFNTKERNVRYFDLSVEKYSEDHIAMRYDSKFLCGDFVVNVTRTGAAATSYISHGNKVIKIPEAAKITKLCSVSDPDIVEVIIPNTVTEVGSFANCTSLKSVSFHDNITQIGSFKNCTSLESIAIPDKVKSIPDLENCTSLKSIHLGDGITSANTYEFKNCTSLETVTGGKNLKSLAGYAFYNCPKLQDAACFHNLNYVDSRAFYGSTAMKTVVLTNSTEAVYSSSFKGMTALETVVIPRGNTKITSIEQYAFYGCSSLKCVSIPASVTSIGYAAFNGATSLETVVFYGTRAQWDAITIASYNAPLNKANIICLGDHTHSFTENEVVKATCQKEGEKTYSCACTADFTYSYTVNTHLTDHNYSATYTVDIPATCTTVGSKSRHCANCDSVTDVTVVEKTAHNYNIKVSEVTASCTSEGSITMKCACGDIEVTPIAKNPDRHSDDNSDGVCDNCGTVLNGGTGDDGNNGNNGGTTAKCDHICHKDGFSGFIWKIMKFVYKIFNLNPTCSCGAAHY